QPHHQLIHQSRLWLFGLSIAPRPRRSAGIPGTARMAAVPHDSGDTHLFSHPVMVRELILNLVPGA
ncbi:MAG: hypothetical protein ACUVQI_05490, partial [Thermochromatium sp.]